jgi:predicted kinase
MRLCQGPAVSDASSILAVLSGLPATGKSSVAARLLAHRAGLHLSTDQTRERLFPRAKVGSELKYGKEASRRTYSEVESRAQKALEAKTPLVILDGTYLRSGDRARATQLGLDAGAEVLLLEIRASESLVIKRLAARRPGADHHSEADLSVYRRLKDKMARREDGYAELEASELEAWAQKPVTAAAFSADDGALRVLRDAGEGEVSALLEALSSDFAR